MRVFIFSKILGILLKPILWVIFIFLQFVNVFFRLQEMETDEAYTYFDDSDDYYDHDSDDEDDNAEYLANQLDADRIPPGAEVSLPWFPSSSTSAPDAANSSGSVAFQQAIIKPESDVEKKHRLFKQFDFVSDDSDHCFSARGSKSGIFGRKVINMIFA